MNAQTTVKAAAAEVRLEKVVKRYGKVTAVKPLDLVIPPARSSRCSAPRAAARPRCCA